MAKFRNKPVVIEAVRCRLHEYADNPLVFDEVPEWLQTAIDRKNVVPDFRSEDYWYYAIGTLEGSMTASPGDWIIRGVKGELYPCKDDIFKATYDPVPEDHTV